jgi:FMN-dependent NADH-azoreductase
MDARDPASVKLYVDGVRVLSGTTFVLTAATGPLGLLAHLEKTTGTATGTVYVDALRAKTSQD